MPSRSQSSNHEENFALALEYSFKYFDLHAKQRMTVFNFFLILSGALAGGIGAALQGEKPYALSAFLLSGLLITLSLVFYKLDLRTSFLIKHAEFALKESEARMLPSLARLVSNEPESFKASQNARNGITRAWTYSWCFWLIFSATTLVGLGGLIYSAKLLGWIEFCLRG